MYTLTHNNPWRFGEWLPTQYFMSLESALEYAKKIGDLKVYDYNFKSEKSY